MRRLIKYLKPYTLLIILSITFLFVQANANLALPDYLSRIVNNGIQQNGVENALAAAVRQSEFEKLTLFIGPEDLELVKESYLLVNPGDPEAEEYRADYPILESQAIYVLQELDEDLEEDLNLIMGKSFVAALTHRLCMQASRADFANDRRC